MTTIVSTVAAWLGTYLVHSTLLLGGVAALTRWVIRREALRETLWKAALVGGVVTATVAMALPRPGALRIDVAALGTSIEQRASTMDGPGAPVDLGAAPAGPAAAQAGATRDQSDADFDRDLDTDTEHRADVEPAIEMDLDGLAGAGVAGPGGGGVSGGGMSGGAAGQPSSGPAPWIVALVALWAVVAAFLLARLGYRHLRLRWLLRDRRQVPGSEPAAVALTELRRTAGVWKPVRLTATPTVATPLALGGVEVCVPERFLTELDDEEQRAALAHELAHLARRDPVWQVGGAVLGALLFFQPLNALARRAIRSTAEYLADAWAVSHTGSRVELAKCLAAVAGWVAPAREPALAGTVAMAEGGSPLLARVQRLLEREPEPPTAAALRVALAVGLVAVAAGFAPAVGSGGVSGEEAREGFQNAPAGEPAAASAQDSREAAALHDLPTADEFLRRVIEQESNDDTRAEAMEGLAFRPDTALAQLFFDIAMDDPSDDIRHEATEQLGRMNAPGVVALLERLAWDSTDEDVQRQAAESLGEVGTVEAAAALGRLMKDHPSERVRWEALDQASEMDDGASGMDGQALLQVALTEVEPDLRREAVERTAELPSEHAVPLLSRAVFESGDETVERQAVESLSEVGTEAAFRVLVEILDRNPGEAASLQAVESLVENFHRDRVLPVLQNVLYAHPPEKVRREALDALEDMGG